jgi:hypothetical protein
MMWKATATQHAEPAVYEVLGAISSTLSPEHQNYLLQLIHSIPFAEYSPRTISLIAQFQNTYSSYPSSTEIRVILLSSCLEPLMIVVSHNLHFSCAP